MWQSSWPQVNFAGEHCWEGRCALLVPVVRVDCLPAAAASADASDWQSGDAIQMLDAASTGPTAKQWDCQGEQNWDVELS